MLYQDEVAAKATVTKQEAVQYGTTVISRVVDDLLATGYSEGEVIHIITTLAERHLQQALWSDARLNSPNTQRRELYAAIGGEEGSASYQAFVTKRDQLAQKWQAQEDSARRRLVFNTLTDHLDILQPICVAILVDNVTFVRSHMTAQLDKENCLRMACLFGSKQTAEYLLSTLGIANFKYKAGILFADMALSYNTDWVKEVFEKQFNARRPLLVDLSQVDENIRAILENPSMSPKP